MLFSSTPGDGTSLCFPPLDKKSHSNFGKFFVGGKETISGGIFGQGYYARLLIFLKDVVLFINL